MPTIFRNLAVPSLAALPAFAAAQAADAPDRSAPLLWLWIVVALVIAAAFVLILLSKPRGRASDAERARRAARGEDPHPVRR